MSSTSTPNAAIIPAEIEANFPFFPALADTSAAACAGFRKHPELGAGGDGVFEDAL
jgi:hypothetical protein